MDEQIHRFIARDQFAQILVHLQEAARQGIGVATRQRHHETADRSR